MPVAKITITSILVIGFTYPVSMNVSIKSPFKKSFPAPFFDIFAESGLTASVNRSYVLYFLYFYHIVHQENEVSAIKCENSVCRLWLIYFYNASDYE